MNKHCSGNNFSSRPNVFWENLFNWKMFIILVGILLINSYSSTSLAQVANSSNNPNGLKITGKVTDSNSGEAMAGVGVLIKGTNNGTITDINGNYSINLSSTDDVLEFSLLGLIKKKFQ